MKNMHRKNGAFRAAASIILLVSMTAVGPAQGEEEAPETSQELVRVLYPQGSCQTGWLAVEIWDREHGRWVTHPRHPLVPAGQCRSEDPGVLLNELRVACIDPSGRRANSPWVVGVQLAPGLPATACREEGAVPAPAAPAE